VTSQRPEAWPGTDPGRWFMSGATIAIFVAIGTGHVPEPRQTRLGANPANCTLLQRWSTRPGPRPQHQDPRLHHRLERPMPPLHLDRDRRPDPQQSQPSENLRRGTSRRHLGALCLGLDRQYPLVERVLRPLELRRAA
jgi:hypothetical protein